MKKSVFQGNLVFQGKSVFRGKFIFTVFLMCMVTVLALMLTSCATKGNVSQVTKNTGESRLYSQEDIEKAMSEAEKKFRADFGGCTLTELWYDEQKTADQAVAWAEENEAEEGIVLLSNFDVGKSGAGGGLTPETTYSDWQWILVRDKGESWRLVTWGYG